MKTLIALSFTSLLLSSACGQQASPPPPSDDMRKAIDEWSSRVTAAYEATTTSVEIVKRFRAVFTNSALSFSSLRESNVRPRVWLRASIANRYILSAWVPVTFSPDYVQIVSVHPVEDVRLEEYAEIVELSSGQIRIRLAPPTQRFTIGQFQKLLDSNGDFSVLGISIMDSAVPGFSKYWNTRVVAIEDDIRKGIGRELKAK